jgi:hypothetical protein
MWQDISICHQQTSNIMFAFRILRQAVRGAVSLIFIAQ